MADKNPQNAIKEALNINSSHVFDKDGIEAIM